MRVIILESSKSLNHATSLSLISHQASRKANVRFSQTIIDLCPSSWIMDTNITNPTITMDIEIMIAHQLHVSHVSFRRRLKAPYPIIDFKKPSQYPEKGGPPPAIEYPPPPTPTPTPPQSASLVSFSFHRCSWRLEDCDCQILKEHKTRKDALVVLSSKARHPSYLLKQMSLLILWSFHLSRGDSRHLYRTKRIIVPELAMRAASSTLRFRNIYYTARRRELAVSPETTSWCFGGTILLGCPLHI